MSIKDYKDLKVWQEAMVLVEECYRVIGNFPRTEMYGLCSQLQRAAVSVPANIAEGHSRWYTGQYMSHLSIARGSLAEVETLLQIANRLKYLDGTETAQLLGRTQGLGKMINGLRKSLQSRISTDH